MNRATEALEYASEFNWPVFPLKGKRPLTPRGFKDASTDPCAIMGYWSTGNPNIGVRTGSGLLVLDVDADKGGYESLRQLKVPDTPSSLTGGGGVHYFFRCPDYVRSGAGLWPGIDLKSVGGYVAAPSSIHPNGQPYLWDRHPSELELALVPDWLLAQANRTRVSKRLPERIAVGERNSTLFSIAGFLRGKGFVEKEIHQTLSALAANRCEGQFPGAEIGKIAKSASKYEPEPESLWSLGPHTYTSRVMDEFGLKGAPIFLVLLTLYEEAQVDGAVVFMGQRLLARRTHLHQETVNKAMQTLETHGLIRREDRGKGKRPLIYVSFPSLPTAGG